MNTPCPEISRGFNAVLVELHTPRVYILLTQIHLSVNRLLVPLYTYN